MNKNIQPGNRKIYQAQKVSMRSEWYVESLAKSLIIFAKNNKRFAGELREIAKGLRPINIYNTVKIKKEVEILMPQDIDSAIRRARWLMGVISNDSLPGSKNAAAILTSWVSDRPIEVPKQLVVGVLAIAIPGVTLGLFPKSKKMLFVIRRDIATQKDLSLTKKITQLSHEVLISSLDLSHGDMRRLEPEISDWFFGDKEISFFKADREKIKEIKNYLSELGIISASSEQGDELNILAISPSVNSFAFEALWELEKFKE